MEASLVARPNRFLGIVNINGEQFESFIPNPGRMLELMVPGKTVFVRHNPGDHRKTDYDMIAVKHEGLIVSIDSNLPNRFIKRLLTERRLEYFADYIEVKPEPRLYDGRFDFLLKGSEGNTLIEVKSCTLVDEGHARFPDAPTTRGARHMRHLVKALDDELATHAAVVFVIQRPDAKVFSPNDPTDPAFGDALRYAEANGVTVLPLVTKVVNWNLELIGTIPYMLDFFL